MNRRSPRVGQEPLEALAQDAQLAFESWSSGRAASPPHGPGRGAGPEHASDRRSAQLGWVHRGRTYFVAIASGGIARCTAGREGRGGPRRPCGSPVGGRYEERAGRHACADIEVLRTTETAADAACYLAAHREDSVPLCQGDGSLAGTVSNRDIVARVVATGRDPHEVRLAEFARARRRRWRSMSTSRSRRPWPSCAGTTWTDCP